MNLNLYEVCYEGEENDCFADASQLYWAESHQEAYELWAKDYHNDYMINVKSPWEIINECFSHVNIVPLLRPKKGAVPVTGQKLKEQLTLITKL